MQLHGETVGVILAGGLARRMGGGDKALLALHGRPLLSHAIARLGPQVAALALSANAGAARFAEFGLPVLPDPLPDHPGPLAGLLAGLDWAAGQGARTVVSLPVDTPFAPADLVARLTQAARDMEAPLAIAAGREACGALRRHPAVGLWPVALRGELRAALERGERRVGGFAEAHGARLAVWDVGARDPFANINTPDDLAAAEERLP
ncbi:molybdenum cofactor guanylyltransferase MobA [Salipiger mucosus]|uniref:Molybdenum cofactor guanylyltransferase n=1 Tax=Salipiger mucosus DSM 16094 TaxID=1123237 RepID=S9QAB4_9RHOB|nr:molybdenum cofactor guanylyltransferase MobA [Salipiger mucosus]EPX76558.1 Molybdopterin-guanine dinucleotide biosynthesis protein MobA [Salipiger mucosus DSM 16094]